MRKALLFTMTIAAAVALVAQEQKEVVTGANYVNDIYYSLEVGDVDTAARENWDLGFTTNNFSISVLANTIAGVEVYTWPLGDTADWATLDTTGMVWTPMYNSLETWDEGAFTVNATGHPDYGWGIYNMNSHVITGDSLFVVKTVGGDFKKLQIIERAAMANTWKFKFANLDGSDEETVMLNSGAYNTKNFVYYSIDSLEIVDREPVSADWDLVFTRYTAMIQMGPTPVPWPVSGVLTNEDHIKTLEIRESGMDQASIITFEHTAFWPEDTWNISNIGYDWKSFSGGSYSMIDTVVYFVKDSIGEQDYSYYKIYFTDFSGSTEGKYTFMQEEVSPVSARDYGILPVLELYPNPAGDYVNVVFDHLGEVSLQIYDMTGRTVYRTTCYAGGLTDFPLDIARLDPGLFFLKLDTGDSSKVLRFIKQ